MEKKLLFSLFFALFSSISWANELADASPSLIESCDAPAPDSFRVTSFSYNFVTLAWNPVAAGDDHFLTVFRENPNNGWDSLYSVLLFDATSYTVSNMDPQKRHKVQISTVCPDGTIGTPSPPVFPPHGVIVELVLFGDPPNIPVEVDCHNMMYTSPEIKWVGFKISRPDGEGGELSNYFQFEKVYNDQDVEARLKRVETDNVLVAANLVGLWPDHIEPVVKANMLFKVGKVENGILNPIGFVLMTINPGGIPSVDICQIKNDPNRPWNPLYDFKAIIVQIQPECQGCIPDPELSTPGKKNNMVKVQNPVSEYLSVFFTETSFMGGSKKFTLIDINGKVIIREQFYVAEPQVAIPLGKSMPGLYFLQIESEGDVQIVKIVIN